MIETFKDFLADDNAAEMYITGMAGTGKTTSLRELVEYCTETRIHTVTTAYTHKAVKVLMNKLPPAGTYNQFKTLHSFLKKVPTVNTDALKIHQVETNSQTGKPEIGSVVFIDEFSMVGEKDYVDLMEVIYDEEGYLKCKIVYLGDLNQLPPVKDIATIRPKKPYWVKLTTIHRQAIGNKLIDNLIALNSYINGEPPLPLEEHETFVRGVDIVDEYMKCTTGKVLLAYTNARVQSLNAVIAGKDFPNLGDEIFSPTLRNVYTLENIRDQADEIKLINGAILGKNSQYKQLETLNEMEELQFFDLKNEDGEVNTFACVFGHQRFLDFKKKLSGEAVKVNKAIQKLYDRPAKAWADENWTHELAGAYKLAWKRYMSANSSVICLDFNHALTVHKSQGSTYQNVFIDTEDLAKCMYSDYKMYLKLLYVAISRASDKVYTN